MTIFTQELPSEYISALQEIKKSGQSEEFLSHIQELRHSGWPLSSIATALGVSKTAVSKWEHKKFTPIPQLSPSPPTYNRPYTLTQEQEQELFSLSQQASTVRGLTPQNSPARKAAHTLEALLIRYRELNTSVTDLAKACNVTRRAINQRLEKYRD